MSHPDNFYLKKEEPNQSCLLVLRQIILDQDQNVTESIKWGIPCFSFKNKIFCFISIEKQTNQPYILFKEGKNLDFPELESRDRKLMKSFHFNSSEDIPIHKLTEILQFNLDLYRSGKIRTK